MTLILFKQIKGKAGWYFSQLKQQGWFIKFCLLWLPSESIIPYTHYSFKGLCNLLQKSALNIHPYILLKSTHIAPIIKKISIPMWQIVRPHNSKRGRTKIWAAWQFCGWIWPVLSRMGRERAKSRKMTSQDRQNPSLLLSWDWTIKICYKKLDLPGVQFNTVDRMSLVSAPSSNGRT